MKINKNIKVLPTLKKTVVKTVYDALYGLIDQIDEISVIIQILTPLLVWNNPIITSYWNALIAGLFLTMFTRLLTSFYRDMQGRSIDDIPVPLKRFTTCSKTGFVEIAQEDGAEVTRYLYELEEWLDKRGMFDNDDSAMQGMR